MKGPFCPKGLLSLMVRGVELNITLGEGLGPDS